MYGYGGESLPIYVDDQLTKETFLLFKETKQLKKIGIAFVWLSNGNILVRETSDSQITRIESFTQLKEFEQSLLLKKQTKDKSQNQTRDNITGHSHHVPKPTTRPNQRKQHSITTTQHRKQESYAHSHAQTQRKERSPVNVNASTDSEYMDTV